MNGVEKCPECGAIVGDTNQNYYQNTNQNINQNYNQNTNQNYNQNYNQGMYYQTTTNTQNNVYEELNMANQMRNMNTNNMGQMGTPNQTGMPNQMGMPNQTGVPNQMSSPMNAGYNMGNQPYGVGMSYGANAANGAAGTGASYGAGAAGGVAGTGASYGAGAAGGVAGTGKAAAAGMSLGAKIAIAVAGAAVVAGGTVATVHFAGNKGTEKNETTTEQQIKSEITAETTTEANTGSTDTTAATEEITTEEITTEAVDPRVESYTAYAGVLSTYMESKPMVNGGISGGTGLIYADLVDFNNDGTSELVVGCGKNQDYNSDYTIEIYELRDGQAVNTYKDVASSDFVHVFAGYNGNIVLAKQDNGEIYYLKAYDELTPEIPEIPDNGYSPAASEYFCSYRYVDGTMQQVHCYERKGYDLDGVGGFYEFVLDGTSVSSDEFAKALEEMNSNAEVFCLYTHGQGINNGYECYLPLEYTLIRKHDTIEEICEVSGVELRKYPENIEEVENGVIIHNKYNETYNILSDDFRSVTSKGDNVFIETCVYFETIYSYNLNTDNDILMVVASSTDYDSNPYIDFRELDISRYNDRFKIEECEYNGIIYLYYIMNYSDLSCTKEDYDLIKDSFN